MSLNGTVDCPYCGSPHKLSETPTEDRPEDVECRDCERPFQAHARIVVSYYASCLDSDHDWEHQTAWPTLDFRKRCSASRRHQ